jgi:T5SS/PEP-CTERM-associated repeat protein
MWFIGSEAMHRILRGKLIVGIFAGVTLWASSSVAQYTLDFQTNLYVGIISNWPGSYIVGSNTIADVLLIESGGTLSSDAGCLGYEIGSSNNSAVVTGTNSVWKGGIVGVPYLYVGYSGAGNSLVISNRGRVSFSFHYIGYNSTSSNNSVLVTGAGSVWSNTFGNIYVGAHGSANSLIVSNGGQVVNSMFGYGYVGLWGSNNVVVITGSNSTWKGNDQFFVGWDGASNSVVVENGGQLMSADSEVGVDAAGAHNRIVVSGSGSVWTNTGGFTFGYHGGDNELVITNGGAVFNGLSGVMLGGPFGSDNKVLVAGTGSVWSTTGGISIGSHGDGNSLVISNGGRAVCSVGSVGSSTGNSNSVLVTGSGSIWNNGSIAYVGNQGSGNSVTVAGGSMLAAGLVIGSASVTCDNFVQLDSGSLIVTNATHDAVLEAHNGQLILNGGVLQADELVMTSDCSVFVRNGGTLIVGGVVIDSNAFRVTSIAQEGSDIRVTWLMGPGQTNALQATTGGTDGSYTTNGFSDIFIVPGIISVGSVTNYLDVGAATNFPTRYYRVRSVQ